MKMVRDKTTRITVSIKGSLLKELDASVNGISIKNRSHAIELRLLNSAKPKIVEYFFSITIMTPGEGQPNYHSSQGLISWSEEHDETELFARAKDHCMKRHDLEIHDPIVASYYIQPNTGEKQ